MRSAQQTEDTRFAPPPKTSAIGECGRSIVTQWALRPGALTTKPPQVVISWLGSERWC